MSAVVKRLLVIFFILFSVACGSSKEKFLINRSLPEKEYSTLKTGGVLVSSSRVIRESGRDRIILSYWRFLSADKKKVTLQYEEYYENIKKKPDLEDKKQFPLDKNLVLDTYKVVIYRLQPDKITYQVEPAVKK